MKHIDQTSRKVLEQRIQSRIRKLGECGISIAGSLNVSTRRCGRKNCQCATDDTKKHAAASLTSKVQGKTRSVFVPTELTKEVESWLQERKKIRELLKEIDELAEQLIRIHVPASRAASRNREATRKLQ
jgi:hypothetical protein